MPIFKIIYWLGLVVEMVIRAPINRERKKTGRGATSTTTTETIILVLLFTGSFLVPVIYSVTNWLEFADYTLPTWLGWVGAVILLGALYVFWRAHKDLQAFWSPTLEIYNGHKLMTGGIYRLIRHPMYASQWLYAIAQVLLLHNWIAGLAGLVVFIPFYFLRMPAEEKMMLATFGEEYRQYMQTSGRVFPKF